MLTLRLIRIIALQTQRSSIQQMSSQPRAGSAGCTCCGVAYKLGELAHVYTPGPWPGLPHNFVITSDMSEQFVSMHSDCLRITEVQPPMALWLMSSNCWLTMASCQLRVVKRPQYICMERQRSGGLQDDEWDRVRLLAVCQEHPDSQHALLEDKALYGLSDPILIIGRDNHRSRCLDLRSTQSLH